MGYSRNWGYAPSSPLWAVRGKIEWPNMRALQKQANVTARQAVKQSNTVVLIRTGSDCSPTTDTRSRRRPPPQTRRHSPTHAGVFEEPNRSL